MFYEKNLTLMPTLQLVDWRSEFTKWWVNEFKAVKFPSAGHVFNYYIDPETKRFMPWTEKVVKFELDTEIPLQVNQKMHLGEAHARFACEPRPSSTCGLKAPSLSAQHCSFP